MKDYYSKNFDAKIIFIDFANESREELLCGNFEDFIKSFQRLAENTDVAIVEVSLDLFAEERGLYEMNFSFNDRIGLDFKP